MVERVALLVALLPLAAAGGEPPLERQGDLLHLLRQRLQ